MHTHHTTTSRPRRRLAAALLLPLLLVLGGCFRLDMGITINENETADVSMEVGDLTGMLTREDMDCSSLESEIVGGPDAEDIDFTVEDTETDGNVGCLITAAGAPLDTFSDDSIGITRDGDNFVFTFSGDDADSMGDMGDMPAGMEPEVAISVTFPGSVVEADDNAEIDGNTVTWRGIEAFSAGGTATGEAASSGIGGGGTSTVLWIVLGVVALLAIAALIFFIVKKKQQESPAQTAPYGAPAAPGGFGQPGAPGSFGQPGAPGDGGVPTDAGAGYSGQPPTGPTTAATDAPFTPPASREVPPQVPGDEPPVDNR